jgi:hypothetical protein
LSTSLQTRLKDVQKEVIAALVRAHPSISQQQLKAVLVPGLPPTRGARAVPRFKPELIRAAYQTLRRLHPEWGHRAAVAELATKYGTSTRTIELYLSACRRKN